MRILSKINILLASLLISFSAYSDGIINASDFVFHKSSEANVEWEIVDNKIIRAKFLPGNPFNVSLWFSRSISDPIPQEGQSYRVVIMVKQSGVTDPQARVNLDVLGADANAVYLNTSCFRKTVWAANCSEWTPVELQFTLPKAGVDAKWNQARVFLTSFSALSSNGTFYFKDYRFEFLSSQSKSVGR